ncbi:hypothetical protein L1887_36172 [Cichorium endivia]|nr:hypothetical protein L1887_36172 [Cichorium endivia]
MSLAVKSGDLDTVHGCVVDHRNINSCTLQVFKPGGVNGVLCMSYLDIDLNSVDSEGQTALHVGASHGYIEVLEFLITLGNGPDLADHKARTPLHCSSMGGQVGAIEFLLTRIRYVKYAVTKEGNNAFDIVVENKHTDLSDMLHLGDVLHRAARTEM